MIEISLPKLLQSNFLATHVSQATIGRSSVERAKSYLCGNGTD